MRTAESAWPLALAASRGIPLANWFNNLLSCGFFPEFWLYEAPMALTQYESRISRALADVLFTPNGSLPDPDEAGVVDRVAAYLGSLPMDAQAQMRALLVAFDVGFAVVMRSPTKRFIDATYEQQQEYVRRCESAHGHQRTSYDGLRLVFVVAYAESPAVLRAIGVHPTGDAVPAPVAAVEAP
ncbi:MAG: hypothetical protein JW751_25330 [Polyangiaceae bacterium]|nr:hypothetical protein [Polyangiaceae bacterium]